MSKFRIPNENSKSKSECRRIGYNEETEKKDEKNERKKYSISSECPDRKGQRANTT